MMRNVRWLAGTALAVGLCLSISAPALAECSGQPNRWPAFSEVAPSAGRIAVGTVMGPSVPHIPGPHYVGLDVRVVEVLLGSAADLIEVNGLKSGLQLSESPSCRQSAYLYARVGDVIAFAFDARLPGVAGPVNTAAWIEGKPHANVPGVQQLTIDEVRYFASLPDTATGAAGASQSDTRGQAQWHSLLLILAAAGALAISRRLRAAGVAS
ncbi:MAG: hypothetical protein WKF46_07995 [Candidatus Limnocylindrales bacterium]